ncbi:MAG: DpnI domain-containing protein [Pseudomonadota bacterium]
MARTRRSIAGSERPARTTRQRLGEYGEEHVRRTVSCPRCKRSRTFRRLPNNFRCADLICDFCGFVAQVKTAKARDTATPIGTYLGAAWGPQKERMDAGIFTSLYIVQCDQAQPLCASYTAVFFLPAEAQESDMFIPRQPLSETARRAGWRSFRIDVSKYTERLIRLA